MSRLKTLGFTATLGLLALAIALQPAVGEKYFSLEVDRATAPGNDTRPGMLMADALEVAMNCIQTSSRIKTADIRAQDTLAFVGINDEDRIDTLRRHIVRNPWIGVRSKFTTVLGQQLRYLLLNDSLGAVETSWTVGKLAQTISENAGIVRLTYERSGQIIADCRALAKIPAYVVNQKSPLDLIKPPAVPTPTPVQTTISVAADFMDGERTKFIMCLTGSNGVGTAKVSDPKGNDYEYAINHRQTDHGIRNQGWTYDQLIKWIAEQAKTAINPA